MNLFKELLTYNNIICIICIIYKRVTMEFEKLKTRIRASQADIKVAFRINPTYGIIYFSHSLLERIGWDKEFRAFVSINTENTKIWMITKFNNENPFLWVNTHKVSHYNLPVNYSVMQFRFKSYPIDKLNKKVKPVDFSLDFSSEEQKIIIVNKI
jgi:hypothetical protein